MRDHTLLEVLFIITKSSDFPENFIEVSFLMLLLSVILLFIQLQLVLILLPIVSRFCILAE